VKAKQGSGSDCTSR